jgi:hypothetical protein
MNTTIPFSGFYSSMHDDEIDRTLENLISDSSGCHPISDRIASNLWMHMGDVSTEYARAFLADFQILFNGETGLSVAFEWDTLDSPRAYNFSTDRIFAKVSAEHVKAMYSKVNHSILDRMAEERFTSCSGFISHYSPDVSSWGELEEWDHNQVGTLVEALVSQFLPKEWEGNVIEDWSGSGIVDEWVYDALDEEGKRLVKIAAYLRQREERQYR